MDVVLWHIEVSHYNEKVRWALDYKAVPHERRAPLPGLHRARALVLTRGAHGRLPVLRLDGRTVGDSNAIIAALEEYAPEPSLYPADPAERAAALELEEYFDRELAPRVRRFMWLHTIDDTDAVVESVARGAGPLRARAVKTLVPAMRPLVKRDYGISGAAESDAREGISAAMDRVERELGPSGYLVGESFSVADLTAAALFTPLLCPPGRQYPPPQVAPEISALRAELEARDAGAWVEETYRRHRGVSAELVA